VGGGGLGWVQTKKTIDGEYMDIFWNHTYLLITPISFRPSHQLVKKNQNLPRTVFFPKDMWPLFVLVHQGVLVTKVSPRMSLCGWKFCS